MPKTFSFQDSILDGITIDDIITAVLSNEKVINEVTVKRVFNELVKKAMENARYELERHIQNIINEVNSNKC